MAEKSLSLSNFCVSDGISEIVFNFCYSQYWEVNICLLKVFIKQYRQRIHLIIVMATGIPYISSISAGCIFCLLILYCLNSVGLSRPIFHKNMEVWKSALL